MHHNSLLIKLILIAQIGLGISMLFSVLVDFRQEEKIKEMRKQISCLEQGRFYVGDELCADKLTATTQ